MKRLFFLGALVVSCFREAPPCDEATLKRIKATCRTEDECLQQIDDRHDVCAERFRSGQ